MPCAGRGAARRRARAELWASSRHGGAPKSLLDAAWPAGHRLYTAFCTDFGCTCRVCRVRHQTNRQTDGGTDLRAAGAGAAGSHGCRCLLLAQWGHHGGCVEPPYSPRADVCRLGR